MRSSWPSPPTPARSRTGWSAPPSWRRAGMWDEAARALGELVAAAPRQPEVRFVMAFVALNRGQAEAAVRDADDALALRAHYPEARLIRAEALLRLARADEARRELRAIPRRGAADDGGRARAGRADPGQRSAIESPPMPLRLRMLPPLRPAPALGQSRRADRGAGHRARRRHERGSESGAGPTWSSRSPIRRSRGFTRGWCESTAAGRSRTSAAPTGRASTANGWRRTSHARSRPGRRSRSVRSPSSSTAPWGPSRGPNGRRPSRAGW